MSKSTVSTVQSVINRVMNKQQDQPKQEEKMIAQTATQVQNTPDVNQLWTMFQQFAASQGLTVPNMPQTETKPETKPEKKANYGFQNHLNPVIRSASGLLRQKGIEHNDLTVAELVQTALDHKWNFADKGYTFARDIMPLLTSDERSTGNNDVPEEEDQPIVTAPKIQPVLTVAPKVDQTSLPKVEHKGKITPDTHIATANTRNNGTTETQPAVKRQPVDVQGKQVNDVWYVDLPTMENGKRPTHCLINAAKFTLPGGDVINLPVGYPVYSSEKHDKKGKVSGVSYSVKVMATWSNGYSKIRSQFVSSANVANVTGKRQAMSQIFAYMGATKQEQTTVHSDLTWETFPLDSIFDMKQGQAINVPGDNTRHAYRPLNQLMTANGYGFSFSGQTVVYTSKTGAVYLLDKQGNKLTRIA